MQSGSRMVVRPRHMALAAVVVAVALLVLTALDAEAAPAVFGGGAAPSPLLLVPVMLAFAARLGD